ncbi:MAG: arylsulfatase, partial [Bacteroidota bacterium]
LSFQKKMRFSFPLFLLSVGWLLTVVACQYELEESRSTPNIVLILADDLGYGELGSYGQSIIETPHLDQLAAEGMRFTQFYSGAPVCAPARCVLLTGQHAGHAHIRGNDEWKERGAVWDFAKAVNDITLEGQRPLPDSILTIAELLKASGYTTGAIGKWGLGAPETEGVPNRQGFDFFYGYNCQRQAHTFYPKHLWRNEEKHWLDNELVPPRTPLPEGADPNDSTAYAKYQLREYTPTLMRQEAINFIQQYASDPFFLYYPTPIPHVPLQAPKHWVDYYRKKIGPEEPYTGDQGYFPCQYPKATYAAMISFMDETVGLMIEELKKQGIYDNTLILFTSDNGPTYVGGSDSPFFNSGGPFKSEYGWGKGFVHEGGIRVPLIASWPGKIAEGSTTDHASIFYDVLPTLCEVAGMKAPDDTDGISFLPTLLGTPQPEQHAFLYWEFPAYKGQQAVRMGNWKGIRKNVLEGNTTIELYDLSTDLQEQNDVAAAHPEVVRQIETIMQREHQPASLERFKMTALGDQKE